MTPMDIRIEFLNETNKRPPMGIWGSEKPQATQSEYIEWLENYIIELNQ